MGSVRIPSVTLAVILTVFTAQAQTGLQVDVAVHEAPLLDAPSASGEVVGQAPQGTVLSATGRRDGDWLEVQAPSMVTGWIYGELVRDGVVAASSVRVRSSAGIGFNSLGTLTKGDAVQKRGSKGDWVEITLPPTFTVWVERALVAERPAIDLAVRRSSVTAPLTAAVSPKPVETPVARPPPPSPPPLPADASVAVNRASVPKVTPIPAYPPARTVQELPLKTPPPAVRVASQAQGTPRKTALGQRDALMPLRLVSGAPQGESVTVAGVLRPNGISMFRPSGFRLVTADRRGPARTICHVISLQHNLSGRIGDRVVVEGRKYWVSGCREPVVRVNDVR